MNFASIFYASLLTILLGFDAIPFHKTSCSTPRKSQPEICITLDDVNYLRSHLFSGLERDSIIRNTLKEKKVKAGMFFIGKYLESEEGKNMMHAWDNHGHLILNHTYSHPHFNDPAISSEIFSEDILKCDDIIKCCKNFKKIFRFPYLEEGNTKEKRDAMRDFFKKENYKSGYVSVMTTDWWINAKMESELSSNPNADILKYKRLYLSNVKECADFYRSLAEKVSGRPVKHVILLHHNLLNALFLGDLIDMLRDDGWKIISAEEAFSDPVYAVNPDFFPSTSSLFTTLAASMNITLSGGIVFPENKVYDKEYLKEFGF